MLRDWRAEGAHVHADRTENRRSPDELWAGLVREMAAMPDVVANLLREHQPDDQGFCRGNGCGTAGRGVPTRRWPCSLHALAAAAADAVVRGGPAGGAIRSQQDR
jgi:hypothetical protein